MSVNEEMPLLIPLPAGCQTGIFIRRHKRFIVEFELAGEKAWAHTNNTGAMLGLMRKGQKILVSPPQKQKRKLPWTLERILIEANQNTWVGVNTLLPNAILKSAFAANLLDFAAGYEKCRGEAVCGGSRLDGCFTAPDKPPLWVECKNVTLAENGIAAFPDAESIRARKHLRELIERCRAGEKSVMFFLVQRQDCCAFAPADYIDPIYSSLFYEAMEAGVEMHVWQTFFAATGTGLGKRLKILSREEYFAGKNNGFLF